MCVNEWVLITVTLANAKSKYLKIRNCLFCYPANAQPQKALQNCGLEFVMKTKY